MHETHLQPEIDWTIIMFKNNLTNLSQLIDIFMIFQKNEINLKSLAAVKRQLCRMGSRTFNKK